MANLSDIFSWFSIGRTPTAQQFRDTFSSYFHKSEKLPIEQIYGLQEEIDKVTTKFKGYHTTLAELQTEYPQASNKKDFFAWVGTPYPGTVWKVYTDGGAWTDTGEVPTQEEIDLAEYAKKTDLMVKADTVNNDGDNVVYAPNGLEGITGGSDSTINDLDKEIFTIGDKTETIISGISDSQITSTNQVLSNNTNYWGNDESYTLGKITGIKIKAKAGNITLSIINRNNPSVILRSANLVKTIDGVEDLTLASPLELGENELPIILTTAGFYWKSGGTGFNIISGVITPASVTVGYNLLIEKTEENIKISKVEQLADEIYIGSDSEQQTGISDAQVSGAGSNLSNNNAYWGNDEIYTLGKITSIKIKAKAGNITLSIINRNNPSVILRSANLVKTIDGVEDLTLVAPLELGENEIPVVLAPSGFYYAIDSSAKGFNIVGDTLNFAGVRVGHNFKVKVERKTKFDAINERLDNLGNQSQNNTKYRLLYNKDKTNFAAGDFVTQSTAGSYSITENGIVFNSAGLSGSCVLNKQYNLGIRTHRLIVRFKANTVFAVGSKYIENNVGNALAVIDVPAKKLKSYASSLDTVPASPLAEVDIPFDVVADRDYIIEYSKNNLFSILKITDTVTAKNAQVIAQGNAAMFDAFRFGLISGTTPTITSVQVRTISNPYIIFFGDSITEGNDTDDGNGNYGDRFCDLIDKETGKPYLVSGRSAGNIDGVIRRMYNELPLLLPKYAVIMIGTNGGNTEAKLSQIVEYCQSLGVIPILNNIPVRQGETFATKNALITQVRNKYGISGMLMNVATSLNNDGETFNPSLFDAGANAVHPNVSGHYEMFLRSLIDTPELYAE